MSIAYHYVHAIVNEKVMSQKLYDAVLWQKRILIVHILFDTKTYYLYHQCFMEYYIYIYIYIYIINELEKCTKLIPG